MQESRLNAGQEKEKAKSGGKIFTNAKHEPFGRDMGWGRPCLLRRGFIDEKNKVHNTTENLF